MKKKNYFAKELMTKKYRPKVVKAKKGKGSFNFKKFTQSRRAPIF